MFEARFAEQIDQFDAFLNGVYCLFNLKALTRAFFVEFNEFG